MMLGYLQMHQISQHQFYHHKYIIFYQSWLPEFPSVYNAPVMSSFPHLSEPDALEQVHGP